MMFTTFKPSAPSEPPKASDTLTIDRPKSLSELATKTVKSAKGGGNPLRITLIAKNYKTGETLVFTNRGKLGKPIAAKASTKRFIKRDNFDYFDGILTFSISLPEGEHRMAAV